MKKTIILVSCLALVAAGIIGYTIITMKEKLRDDREEIIWHVQKTRASTEAVTEVETIIDDEGNTLVVIKVPDPTPGETSNESKIDPSNTYAPTGGSGGDAQNPTTATNGAPVGTSNPNPASSGGIATITYTTRATTTTQATNPTWQTLSPTSGNNETSATAKNTTVAASDGNYNGYKYHRQSDGNVEITGFTGSGSINIPSSIDGYNVTSIATGAFYGASVSSITIPNTVRSIGQCAFSGICHDGSLSVSIPSSVTYIGGGAFSGINVTQVSNGYSLDQGCVYYGTKLVSASGRSSAGYSDTSAANRRYTIKPGTTQIDDYAFRECTLLQFIDLPSSLTSIGIGGFYGCSNWGTYAEIPAGVSYIEAYTFVGCSRLNTIKYMYVTQEVIDRKEAIYNTSAFGSNTNVIAANDTFIIRVY